MWERGKVGFRVSLGWHVCRVNFVTKDFLSYEFSYEKCSEIFPGIFEPLFCGSEKNPGKFPPNFPLNFPNFPAKNQKKFTDELLQERREKVSGEGVKWARGETAILGRGDHTRNVSGTSLHTTYCKQTIALETAETMK